ncbi:17172_t:CDS:10, partial [Acaulospora morrowiae]
MDSVYGKCAQCERFNTSFAWCQSCDPFKATQGWTSGNNNIDDCIKELQLKSAEYENVIEWIPFNRLSNLRKIGLNFQALWLDGIRITKNNTQSRTLPYSVEIKKFNYPQIDALEFMKESKNYTQLEDNERRLFGITRDTTTGQYMVVFDDFYNKRNIIYGNCIQCERHNTSEAWCQPCDSFKTIQGWTSGDKDIDECIKEEQLKSTKYEDVIEWIPFNRLSNLRKIGLNFQALWLDGIRIVNNNTQSRTLSCSVKITKFNNSQINTLEFIKELKNYRQLRDNERKLYGITQDTTNQYMLVFDALYHKGNVKCGKCKQCKGFNTSEAWCQPCDSFKTIQGWTSGNNNIDKYIKEAQLKTTKYENVIEWIPLNRLSNLQKTGLNFQALWLDGIRTIKNNTQSRTLPYPVEINKFNYPLIDTLKFMKFKNYIQLEDNKRKLYGITQNTTSEYMFVSKECYYKRDIKYGNCTQCERNNTSEAWCQSCDPFKTTQGWTSGDKDIDECIKEAQLKSTEYENVVEWIPFNRLLNLQEIGLNFQALWLDGIRIIKNNTQLRTLPYPVEIKKFNYLQIDALEFMKELKNYIQLEDNERKLFGITRDTTTGQYMIVFDDFYNKRNIIYGKCIQCERYNTSEAWCQPCDSFKTIQGWTSEDKDIDECIKEAQLKSAEYEDVIEWIPFNRLSNLRKIGLNFQALWLDGIRVIKNNTQLRTLPYSVEIKKFNYPQIGTLEFIKEFKNYIQLEDNERKLFGITRDTTTGQYMIVFDDFYNKRNIIYGKCIQCERYNTSEAWCQPCDSFKTIQGWTSGDKDIDECIKEAQLKSAKYEDVIEWIPFNRLSNLQEIGLNFQALWLDGIRTIRNNTHSRTLSCLVELKRMNHSQINRLEFMKECERYNTSEAWCQSCDSFKTIQGWTSGDKGIDECIKESQLKSTKYEDVIEWIPFNRLSNLQKIGLNFQALWLDGIRNVRNNTQSRTLSCSVELMRMNDSQINRSEFMKEFKNYMQLEDNKRKLYGITQNTITGQYMIVFDDFYNKRRWTSGNKDIDECIKELQLKATKYEDVIEWIPFDKLLNLKKIEESKFNAQWLDGIRKLKSRTLLYKQFNTLEFIQSRELSCTVELIKLDDSQIDTLEFIKKLKNYMQLKNGKLRLYGITQDTTTNQYMVVFDDFHCERDILYGKCAHCNRYNTSEAWCQSCDPFKTTQEWTSGSKDIDDYIKGLQLKSTRYEDVIEWIPFNRLSNLQKIDEYKFHALWLDGIRKVKNNTQLRTLSCLVELQKLDGLQIDALKFIKKFKSFVQFENNGHKIFGITQNTTSKQYMTVIDYCISRRDEKYGVCRWDEHYNTSRGWCQSCDPFEITQAWTSESIDVDDCIKEFQFIATEYEKIIEWIPFDRLNNIQHIGKGGFGDVFSANWIDGKRKVLNDGKGFIQSRIQSYLVALKTLSGSSSSADFLREFKNHMRCRLMGSSLEGSWLERSKSYIIDLGLSRKNEGTPDFYVEFSELCMNFDPQKRPTAKEIFYKLEEWYNLINDFDETEYYDDTQEIDRFEFKEFDEIDESKVEMLNKFLESDEIVKQSPVALQIHQDS